MIPLIDFEVVNVLIIHNRHMFKHDFFVDYISRCETFIEALALCYYLRNQFVVLNILMLYVCYTLQVPPNEVVY